ncbi:DUF2628 domain-containing protein [Methylobacterium persicinum]|uniref:DUF2628 domain-containing protein n=1 Tax=Methylobacterium persicinum TaxID=374426 RepID=A0ABU0HIN4_9HYPH|nr:DUF2628 domain-containing protein [Methylobacterium persicinum]MDQ0442186.1 hypothetical protein [Methylobacterium persicinum]GJE40653.1 hypothetical protein KHHGKMAE_4748 [Methylobacterium persicinum]
MRLHSYTLHLPPEARPGDADGLDRAVLVRDGFSWPAFAFTVLWFLFHRLWVAALIVLAGLLVLAFGGYALGLSRAAGAAIAVLGCILIGLEAGSLRRWTLARRGWVARDAVLARDSAEAEARAITRWLDPATLPQPPRPPFPGGPVKRPEPVIGLFPAREGGR